MAQLKCRSHGQQQNAAAAPHEMARRRIIANGRGCSCSADRCAVVAALAPPAAAVTMLALLLGMRAVLHESLPGFCCCLSICLKACVTAPSASYMYNTMMRQPIAWSSLLYLYVHLQAVRKYGRRTGAMRQNFHMAHLTGLGYSRSISPHPYMYAIAVGRYDASKSYIVVSIRRPRRLPRLVVGRRRSAGHSWEAAAESAAYAK